MFTLTSFTTSCSSAIRSRTGATAWQGPHHSAQKSTITLPPDFSTSVSNVSVVALVAIGSFRLFPARAETRPGSGFFPLATIARMFTPLPDKPDHPALELEILEVWEREQTFEQLRERNRGGPAWSFIDGPVTANKTLPVHTAWGRTLKDVFQRYKALRGFDQRYQ